MGGNTRQRPAARPSPGSLNPQPGWCCSPVALPPTGLMRKFRDMHSAAPRSHSSMRWHEIQTQLCLPVLIYSPLVRESTSPPKNVGVTKPGGVGRAAGGLG